MKRELSTRTKKKNMNIAKKSDKKIQKMQHPLIHPNPYGQNPQLASILQAKPPIPPISAQQQQMRQVPPSKIPPRGYRRPRQPKDIPIIPSDFSDNFNSPTLNEMMAFDTHPSPTNVQKMNFVNKKEEIYKKNHEEASNAFFSGITRPQSELPLPELPRIHPSTVFTPHYDQPSFIDGLYFSVQEVQSQDDYNYDQFQPFDL